MGGNQSTWRKPTKTPQEARRPRSQQQTSKSCSWLREATVLLTAPPGHQQSHFFSPTPSTPSYCSSEPSPAAADPFWRQQCSTALGSPCEKTGPQTRCVRGACREKHSLLHMSGDKTRETSNSLVTYLTSWDASRHNLQSASRKRWVKLAVMIASGPILSASRWNC